MQHEPYGCVAHAQFPADMKGRNAAFITGVHVCGDKPFLEIDFRLMKDRASSNGVLMIAFGAFEDTRTRREMMPFGMTAFIARKSI